MSSASPNVVTVNFSSRWFFMPPIAAILTIAAAGFFSSGAIIPVDPAIWGLVGLMFILLTFLYGTFIKRHYFKGLLPVQLTAQGILLCPLSLRMGAAWLSWIGVLLAISGAVVLAALYYLSRANHVVQIATPSLELDNLPVPFAITDAGGHIVSVSALMLQLLQKNHSAVDGERIDAVLPFDKDIISMGGKEWRIMQTAMDGGNYCFQLEEVREVTVTPHADTVGENSFIDPATSLYTLSYMAKRIEEEFYRIYRYKRSMSATILRVYFREPEGALIYDIKKEDEIFNDYCRFVKSNLRETDISCLTAPREIIAALPETTLEGAQDAVAKLSDFSVYLLEKKQEFNGRMDIIARTVFFNASSGVLDFDRFMEKMDEAMKS